MSVYTWAAFILATAVTVIAVVMSLLGIRESIRDAESPRWAYKRTRRMWIASAALWAAAGLVEGVVDGQWVEAAIVLAVAAFMAWVIRPGKKQGARS